MHDSSLSPEPGKIPGHDLGSALRLARAEHGLTLAEVETETKIRAAYLSAFEDGQFHELPPEIYVRRILKNLCYFYGLDAPEVLAQYKHERQAFQSREAAFSHLNLDHRSPTSTRRTVMQTGRFIHAHRIAVLAGASLMFLLLAGYVFQQVKSFAAAPHLALEEPREDVTVTHRSILVKGNSEVGATVKINNQEVLTDENGAFQVPYELARGDNLVTVIAQKKNGKISRLIRTVRADYPEDIVPPAPNDGFLAVVTANAKTWVRVTLDGETTFEGLIGPADQKQFRGKADLQLRTGNAGATRVAINGQDQGVLGREGRTGSFLYTDPRTVGMNDSTRSTE